MEKEVILSLIKEGIIAAFMVWLIKYTIPFIDKWVARWMNDVSLKFDRSGNIDRDLFDKYHELDKKVDQLSVAIESIQVELGIRPDRRKRPRHPDPDQTIVNREYEGVE